MKRKYILAVLAVTCTIFAAGCGAKADVPQNTAQTEVKDNTQADGSTDSADKSDGTDLTDSTISGDKAEADDNTQTDNTDTEQTVTG